MGTHLEGDEQDADRFWARTVERLRLDREDHAAAAHFRAELELEREDIDDPPLSANEVDAIVAHAVGAPAHRLRAVGRGARAPRRRLRRAVWVPGALLLAAAVPVAIVVWNGRDSDRLDYRDALTILANPDESPDRRRSALINVQSRVTHCIATIRDLKRPTAPPALRMYATDGITRLRDFFLDPAQRVVAQPPTDDQLKSWSSLAMSADAGIDARLHAASGLALGAAAGLEAIRVVHATVPNLHDAADLYRRRLLGALQD